MNSRHIKEKHKHSPVSDIIIMSLVFLVILYLILKFFFGLYWMDKQAIVKLKDPSNIKQGCLYFVKSYKVKYGTARQYRINNMTFSDYDMFLKEDDFTPFKKGDKAQQFYTNTDTYGRSQCYKVSYLQMNYIIVKKAYIYDYFGMEPIRQP